MVFGVIAGVFTGLGMGGGTVLILLLTLFQNVEQKLAQSINLIFFIPASTVAIIYFIKNKQLKVKESIVLVISGILGALIGSKLSSNINGDLLRKFFSIFILLIACFEIYKFYMNNIRKPTKTNKKEKEWLKWNL